MKKYLCIILLAITVFALFSCSVGGNGDGGKADGNTAGAISIVSAGDMNSEALNALAAKISNATGSEVTVSDGIGDAVNFEIVIGDTTRGISASAYKVLGRIADEEAEGNTTYVIYSDSGAIAIAYDSAYSRDAAIDYFVEYCLTGLFEYKSGTVASNSIPLTSYLAEIREAEREEGFSAVAEALGEDTAEALRKLYLLYDEEIYIWLANLWDPDIGGFYYSASGRDTVGYLPDLESTRQALSYIQNTGLLSDYGDDCANILSADTKAQIISWVQSLQSSTDGYFYHPQWGRNIKDSRRGRDLNWATTILSSFGAKPYYDTPNGKLKGTLGAPGAVSYRLTESLGRGTVTAVSKVVPTASASGLPDYLKSTEKWVEYIEGLNLPTNSYSAGNTLSAIALQIKTAGSEYVKILIDYLNSHQNPENGLWEERTSYESVNGLMKISEAMATLGYSINYMEEALDSCIEVALMPELTPENNEHVCSVYNPWVAMNAILSSAKNSVSEAYAETLRKQIIEKAPALIEQTRKKIAIFKKNDGGFSYYADYCASNSQGAPVALPQTAESDVNATGISSNGIASNICEALGIDYVHIFTAADGEYFLSLFNSLGTIIKDPEPDFEGPTERVATFTDGVYDTLYVRNYFGISSTTSASISEYDEMLSEGFDPITNFDIVPDPKNSKNKVLRVICEKSKEYLLGSTRASVSNATPAGSCYTLEFRMYYTDILEKGDVMQLHFQSGKDTVMSLRLCADASKKNLSVIEYNSTGSGSNTVPGVSIPTDEWVSLKIEFYQTFSADTTMVKLYVGTDGDEPLCVADINAYRDIALDENMSVTTVNIAHQRTNGSTVYIDDIALTQTDKDFAPITKETVAGFEDGDSPLDYVTNTMTNGELTVIQVDKDPQNSANNVLKVVGKSGGTSGTATKVDISNSGDAGSTYAFETKLYFTGLSKTLHEDIIQINFNGTSKAMGFAFKGTSDARKVSLVGRNSNGTSGTGNAEIKNFEGKTVSLDVDTWYTFRIEYYATGNAETAMTKVYLAKDGGELECIAEANIYYNTSITEISSVNMAWQKWDTEYTVYADDISLFVSDNEFVSEASKLDGEYVPSAEVLSAKGGATGIIALMHDDGYYDSAIAMDKLLLKHGLVGDVGMIANKVNDAETVEQWQALLDTNRWNIVSHSMSHKWWGTEPDDGDYTKLADDMAKVVSEFIESQALLREKFPGQRVLTFAWPGFSEIYNKYVDAENGITKEMVLEYMESEYVRALVDEYYISGRNGTGYVSIGDSDTVWNYMPTTHISSGNISSVLNMIDSAASNGYFCVLYTHKIIEAKEGETVSGTGTYIASYYIDDVYEKVAERVADGSVWNAFYEDAVLYIREYQNSTVSVSGDAAGLSVTLTDTLDNTIYNYPLTVKIAVPASWQAAKIVQGTTVSYAKVVKYGLKSYILADIVPDGGEAAITSCALSEVPEEETPEVIPTPSFKAEYTDFEDSAEATLDSATSDVLSYGAFLTNTAASTDMNAGGDGYKYISFDIGADPKNAANKVLMVQVTSGGASSSKTDLALQTVDYGGVCYVFEGDFYYGKDFTDNTQVTQITFKNLSSNKVIYSVTIDSVTDGEGNAALKITDNNKEYGIGTLATLVEGIATEDWFNLKIEFWRTKSADTTVAKIYIDGECVAEDRSYRNNALINWELDQVAVSHMRYNSHTVLLDNLCFSQISKTYVKTDFGDEGGSDTPASTVEGFDAGTATSGNVTTSGTWTTTDVTVDKDPTDGTNNVLKATQTYGSGSGSQYVTEVALANPDAVGSCYTFEMKIYFTGMDKGTSPQDLIQMYFTDASNNRAAGYGFKDDSAATKVYFNLRNNVTNGSVSDFNGSSVRINANKWYTLRYELYVSGDASTYITKIYIGEGDAEPTCVAEVNAYTEALITDISKFRLVWQKYNTEYTVYLDDISLTRSDKTFVSDAPTE